VNSERVRPESCRRALRCARRGDAHQLGEFAPRGFLTAVNYGKPPEIEPTSSGRKELGEWIANEKNPLTARVAVNRYWQSYFGTGLVKTAEDFGSQGEWPSHPELLDWLATEFMRTGWDVKALQKLIVTSAAYRESSRATPDLVQRDPENRLLARGPRVS